MMLRALAFFVFSGVVAKSSAQPTQPKQEIIVSGSLSGDLNSHGAKPSSEAIVDHASKNDPYETMRKWHYLKGLALKNLSSVLRGKNVDWGRLKPEDKEKFTVVPDGRMDRAGQRELTRSSLEFLFEPDNFGNLRIMGEPLIHTVELKPISTPSMNMVKVNSLYSDIKIDEDPDAPQLRVGQLLMRSLDLINSSPRFAAFSQQGMRLRDKTLSIRVLSKITGIPFDRRVPVEKQISTFDQKFQEFFQGKGHAYSTISPSVRAEYESLKNKDPAAAKDLIEEQLVKALSETYVSFLAQEVLEGTEATDANLDIYHFQQKEFDKHAYKEGQPLDAKTIQELNKATEEVIDLWNLVGPDRQNLSENKILADWQKWKLKKCAATAFDAILEHSESGPAFVEKLRRSVFDECPAYALSREPSTVENEAAQRIFQRVLAGRFQEAAHESSIRLAAGGTLPPHLKKFSDHSKEIGALLPELIQTAAAALGWDMNVGTRGKLTQHLATQAQYLKDKHGISIDLNCDKAIKIISDTPFINIDDPQNPTLNGKVQPRNCPRLSLASSNLFSAESRALDDPKTFAALYQLMPPSEFLKILKVDLLKREKSKANGSREHPIFSEDFRVQVENLLVTSPLAAYPYTPDGTFYNPVCELFGDRVENPVPHASMPCVLGSDKSLFRKLEVFSKNLKFEDVKQGSKVVRLPTFDNSEGNIVAEESIPDFSDGAFSGPTLIQDTVVNVLGSGDVFTIPEKDFHQMARGIVDVLQKGLQNQDKYSEKMTSLKNTFQSALRGFPGWTVRGVVEGVTESEWNSSVGRFESDATKAYRTIAEGNKANIKSAVNMATLLGLTTNATNPDFGWSHYYRSIISDVEETKNEKGETVRVPRGLIQAIDAHNNDAEDEYAQGVVQGIKDAGALVTLPLSAPASGAMTFAAGWAVERAAVSGYRAAAHAVKVGHRMARLADREKGAIAALETVNRSFQNAKASAAVAASLGKTPGNLYYRYNPVPLNEKLTQGSRFGMTMLGFMKGAGAITYAGSGEFTSMLTGKKPKNFSEQFGRMMLAGNDPISQVKSSFTMGGLAYTANLLQMPARFLASRPFLTSTLNKAGKVIPGTPLSGEALRKATWMGANGSQAVLTSYYFNTVSGKEHAEALKQLKSREDKARTALRAEENKKTGQNKAQVKKLNEELSEIERERKRANVDRYLGYGTDGLFGVAFLRVNPALWEPLPPNLKVHQQAVNRAVQLELKGKSPVNTKPKQQLEQNSRYRLTVQEAQRLQRRIDEQQTRFARENPNVRAMYLPYELRQNKSNPNEWFLEVTGSTKDAKDTGWNGWVVPVPKP